MRLNLVFLLTQPLLTLSLSAPIPTTTQINTGGYTFSSQLDYESHLRKISTLPKGFAVGSSSTTFDPIEAPQMKDLPIRLTLITCDKPTRNWASVFTKNAFPGAPVIVGKQLREQSKMLNAIVVNNKVSNVCAGGDGVSDAEAVARAVKSAIGGKGEVLPSSTGVIGWRIPRTELIDAVPEAIKNLQSSSILPAAESIMTTDRFPKVASRTLSNGAILSGIAKGAGMIEPNMATMLSYILTDADIPGEKLQEMLNDSVDKTYNSISVDGDESTSDTVVCVSSGYVGGGGGEEFMVEFKRELDNICLELSELIVRNGEGTKHVIEVEVTNFPGDDAEARKLGRHVVNSPLFKCAVSGNDPNTGRLAAAVGSFMGKRSENWTGERGLELTLGSRVIFKDGQFVLETDEGLAIEDELSDYMRAAEFEPTQTFPEHSKTVKVGIHFRENGGSGSARVFGSDLTSDYVSINADYRS